MAAGPAAADHTTATRTAGRSIRRRRQSLRRTLMPEKKIIVVVGATGAQGGGLLRAITSRKDSQFKARAITRDAKSDKAKELAKLGAEVVQASLDDPVSMRRAFAGAYGAFCVTFFWDHFSAEREIEDVRNMAQAAKAN